VLSPKKRHRSAAISVLVILVALALQLAFATGADAARMPKSLRDAIKANPTAAFKVIVTGTKKTSSSAVENKVKTAQQKYPSKTSVEKKRHVVTNAVSGTFTGAQLAVLDVDSGISSIVRDSTMRMAGYSNLQEWPKIHQAGYFWNSASSLTAPTIAIVDSGIDSTKADFGGRVLTQVNLATVPPNSPGDGRGHGTFVGSIAAGESGGYAGFVPTAKLVSLDVLNDNGEGLMSDVIAAADWIYQNKSSYNIRVANFSLTGSTDSSFLYDPVNKAIEKLWFSGVVVVTAAGNYGSGSLASGVRYAPGNDPFVITVGAADLAGTVTPTDDFEAPWSAWGYTYDGFSKPELGAGGRYMNAAVPTVSTMYLEHPDRVVAPGYMWMSGTSFAAPVVAGAAAYVLAVNPSLTPDQVKGALMLSAQPGGLADPNSLGVGTIRGYAATLISSPPNPNLALNAFLTSDPNGGSSPIFDGDAWAATARANASWNSASWNSASWNSASWNSASWNSASWNSASWNSASWNSGSLSDGTLPTASWASSIYVN
jgi:serine protease AprX